jgi:hypothetical protein
MIAARAAIMAALISENSCSRNSVSNASRIAVRECSTLRSWLRGCKALILKI